MLCKLIYGVGFLLNFIYPWNMNIGNNILCRIEFYAFTYFTRDRYRLLFVFW